MLDPDQADQFLKNFCDKEDEKEEIKERLIQIFKATPLVKSLGDLWDDHVDALGSKEYCGVTLALLDGFEAYLNKKFPTVGALTEHRRNPGETRLGPTHATVKKEAPPQVEKTPIQATKAPAFYTNRKDNSSAFSTFNGQIAAFFDLDFDLRARGRERLFTGEEMVLDIGHAGMNVGKELNERERLVDTDVGSTAPAEFDKHTTAVIETAAAELGIPGLTPHSQARSGLDTDCWIGGRVLAQTLASDDGEKLFVLEDTRENSNGAITRLILDGLQSYTLFSGQALVVNGRSISGPETRRGGNQFQVKKIYSRFDPSDGLETMSYSQVAKNNMYVGDRPLGIVIATGPFMIKGTLNFDPLKDLLKAIDHMRPDALVLMGPFVDEDVSVQLLAKHKTTIQEIFKEFVLEPVKEFELSQNSRQDGGHCHIFMQPSMRDALVEPVFPQLPLAAENPFAGLNLISNPALLRIGGVVFAFSNLDVMRDIDIIHYPPNLAAGKIKATAEQMLRQQTLVPGHPGPVGVDWSKQEHFTWNLFKEGSTPDVLVVPSVLDHRVAGKKVAAEAVGETVVVNPGSVLKFGVNRGVYACLSIHPTDLSGIAPNGDYLFKNRIHERMRVDILDL